MSVEALGSRRGEQQPQAMHITDLAPIELKSRAGLEERFPHFREAHVHRRGGPMLLEADERRPGVPDIKDPRVIRVSIVDRHTQVVRGDHWKGSDI
jgi:hypothetical protein